MILPTIQIDSLKALVCAVPLMLAACGGGKDEDQLANLDAELTNNASDPALRGALEGQIVVDPNLTAQSNINAVRSGEKPVSGGVPSLKAADATAQALKVAGGKLLHAPSPTQAKPCPDCGPDGPATLGAMAREQGKRHPVPNGCNAKLAYSMQWAQRLPEPFGLYPGAALVEAAGADGPSCAIRAASFVASASMPDVIDFYYTQAKRAGYDAEHQLMDGEHVLGGVRASDDGAYFMTFAKAPNGGTAVDVVANKGR
ncbi:MAG: hypothetical protein QHC67_00800 [Sphingobium sp.]|uniref:hypothetical protein n=1 Tax=Sphingobium sp. TaxID=1912891 RepID=UPI0029BEF235|nr:hypothetical protein [Sphingobium sp.]MDX3908348.1 hypothetical protein [Sphingobium sp.]